MRYGFLLIGLITTFSFARPPIKHHKVNNTVQIAIMDTGLDVNDMRFKDHICGAFDFTGTGTQDNIGHGTHVAGLIMQYAKDKDYCFIIMKVFNEITTPGDTSRKNLYNAYSKLREIQPDIVNFSGGGNSDVENEEDTISYLSDTKFFVAAGNDNKDIRSPEGAFFPASFKFPNLTPVGSIGYDGRRSPFSNFGEGVAWELGEFVDSFVPFNIDSSGHRVYSGTSMATAIYTGKYVNKHY